MDADKMYREKTKWELRKNTLSYIEQIQEVTLHEMTAVQPLTSDLKNHLRKTNKTCRKLLDGLVWFGLLGFMAYQPL